LRYANFLGGSGGSTLSFVYRVKPGDNTSALDWALEPSTSQPSFLLCNGTNASNGCALVNRIDRLANLTLSAGRAAGASLSSLASAVAMGTEAPRVARIYSPKNTSTSADQSYTVGELILVIVEFDKPVPLTLLLSYKDHSCR